MSDLSIGAVRAKVVLDLSDLRANATAARSILSGLGSSMTSSIQQSTQSIATSLRGASSLFTQAGTVMMTAGLGVAAGLGSAVSSATEFEKQLRNTDSIAKLTAGQFKELHDNVLSLAKDPNIRQGPIDLSKSLYDIYSSGFEGKKALDILRQSAYGASAGLTSTATSGKVLVGILNSHIKGAENAKTAMDVLFRGVDKGIYSFEQLSHTMGRLPAFANKAHISLQEMTAAQVILTRAGLPLAQSNTALANLFNKMTGATGPMLDAAKAIGIQFGEAALKGKTFGTWLADVKQKLEAYAKTHSSIQIGKRLFPVTGVEDLYKRLFPDDRAQLGFLLLTKNVKEYNEQVGIMQEASKGAGATQQALARQNMSLAAQVDLLKKNFEVLAISAGEALMPALQQVVTWASNLTKWFQDLPKPTRDLIIQFAAMAAGALVVGGGLALLAGQVLAFAASAVTAGPLIAAVTAAISPFTGTIFAIGAALALLAVAWANDWGHIREITASAFGFLEGIVRTGMSVISGIVRTFLAALHGDWNTVMLDLGVILGRAFTWAQNICRDATTAMRNTIQNGLNQIQTIWRDAVMNMVIAFARGASDIIGTLKGMIFNMIATITASIGSIYNAALNMGEAFQRGFSQGSQPSSGNRVHESIRDRMRPTLARGHVEADVVPGFEMPKFSPSGGGGGGGRGGHGGGGGLGKMKHDAEALKQAIDDTTESIFKLTHSITEGLRLDTLNKFYERVKAGVPILLAQKELVAANAKITADRAKEWISGVAGIAPKITEIKNAYDSMGAYFSATLKSGKEQADAYAKSMADFAITIRREFESAYQIVARDKFGKGFSNLLGGADLGEMSRQLGSFFGKTVEAAKEAQQAIEQQAESAADVQRNKFNTTVDAAKERALEYAAHLKQLFTGIADQMTGVLEGALKGVFEHGFKNFFKNILDGFTEMLEKMVAQFIAKQVIFGLFNLFGGGGLLGGFHSFVGFDNWANDRTAQHWGFDFSDHFSRGMADFATHNTANKTDTSSRSVQVHAPITIHASINNDLDIRDIADKLALHIQRRGPFYRGTG